jgi:hypothetical protein
VPRSRACCTRSSSVKAGCSSWNRFGPVDSGTLRAQARALRQVWFRNERFYSAVSPLSIHARPLIQAQNKAYQHEGKRIAVPNRIFRSKTPLDLTSQRGSRGSADSADRQAIRTQQKRGAFGARRRDTGTTSATFVEIHGACVSEQQRWTAHSIRPRLGRHRRRAPLTIDLEQECDRPAPRPVDHCHRYAFGFDAIQRIR